MPGVSSSRPRRPSAGREIDVQPQGAAVSARRRRCFKIVQREGRSRPSSRSRSARSSGATSSSTPPTWPWRPTCASWPAGCRQRRARLLEGAAGRGLQGARRGARRGPRPIRRLAEGQGRRPASTDAGPVRPGDVGLRRRPRAGRARAEGRRGALEGPRRWSATISPAAEPAGRSEPAADARRARLGAVPGAPDMIRRLELLTRIVQLMPPPRHDDDGTPEKTALHRVARGRETTSRPSTPCGFRPNIIRCAAIRRSSSCTPGQGPAVGDRRVGRRGRAPRLHLDRAGIRRSPGQPPDYRYTHQRARRRRARAARRPQALRDRQRPRLRRRPAHRRQHGLGLAPGPSRPVRRRRRHLRAARQVRVRATCPTTSGCRSSS